MLILPAAAALAATAGSTIQAAPQRLGASVTIDQNVQYLGKPNNIRMSNGTVELMLTTDYGPRIMRYAFVGAPDADNVFATIPPVKPNLKTDYGEWFIYGGHRLWHAPEAVPRDYEPDNTPIKAVVDGNTVKLMQPTEPHTNIEKEIDVTLDSSGTHVTVLHKLTNHSQFSINMAVWALTAMNKGGKAIFPQEPYKSHDEEVRPARALTVWGYTDLTDPRWMLGKAFITLTQDTNGNGSQKIGILNKQGWGAYSLRDLVFMKRFDYVPGATYPDYDVNCETYTDPVFLELETLGPLKDVAPGETLTYTENWYLFKGVDMGTGEAGIAAAMQPLVAQTAPH